MPSYADSDVIFKALHLPLNGGGRLILSDGLEASCKRVLKLSWDSEDQPVLTSLSEREKSTLWQSLANREAG
jgi:hypothetical protein